jgi:hypothetical protein
MAAVQIQDFHGDKDPNNHEVTDTFDYVNEAYYHEQVKATVAIAGHLLEPIAFEHKIRLPLLFVSK